MNKIEIITLKELKKLIKLSIAIDVKLRFYLAWHQSILTIDRANNWNSNKTAIYNINTDDRRSIFILLNAYAKLRLKRYKHAITK